MLLPLYEQYTEADHSVWQLLYTGQLKTINALAYCNFAEGVEKLGFLNERIPDLALINQRLSPLTGWEVYAVPGLIPNSDFFQRMADKQFGVTTWIRKMEDLHYLEEPDMFHDVFGHVPLLADPIICDYLHGLARIALKYIANEEVIEAIARVYWYTIEFGMVKENNQLKIYGAGILSSIGESGYCLSAQTSRVPFNLGQILQTPYIKDTFQEKYFVLESMDQLSCIINSLELYFKVITRKN